MGTEQNPRPVPIEQAATSTADEPVHGACQVRALQDSLRDVLMV